MNKKALGRQNSCYSVRRQDRPPRTLDTKIYSEFRNPHQKRQIAKPEISTRNQYFFRCSFNFFAHQSFATSSHRSERNECDIMSLLFSFHCYYEFAHFRMWIKLVVFLSIMLIYDTFNFKHFLWFTGTIFAWKNFHVLTKNLYIDSFQYFFANFERYDISLR